MKVARLAAAVLAIGCAGSPPRQNPSTNGDATFSNSGTLHVSLTSFPEGVPVRGVNEVDLFVVDADEGAPVEGLLLSMVPFMPAMGHGSSVAPQFSDRGGGEYHFDDVVLSMPGLWELRTAITGELSDSVTFRFDVR